MIFQVSSPPDTILGRMAALGDPIRCRILLLLERQELSVTELCSTLQLPQSTVSRHLKVLATDGWLEARKEGTSRLYSVRQPDSGSTEELWRLVRGEFLGSAEVREDRRRLEAVLASRSSGSKAFFSSAAHRWSEMRNELFGSRFDLEAVLALVDPDLTVGDLGAGTGQLLQSLAPYVHRIIGVDESPEMLDAASARLAGIENVELRHGRLEKLPMSDGRLDAALLVLVLHHLPQPGLVFHEAARVLKPGGRFLLVDMLPHGREEYRREMGHVWLGFESQQIETWFRAAGFGTIRIVPLRPQPEASGPSLFVASGVIEGPRKELDKGTAEAALA